jgi:hypothetical protein
MYQLKLTPESYEVTLMDDAVFLVTEITFLLIHVNEAEKGGRVNTIFLRHI